METITTIILSRGIKETESYEEVLEAQKQGCHVETVSDEFELEVIFDEEEVKEYRVLGEAFLVEPEIYDYEKTDY